MNPGGKGANQAIAAARLGSEVTFISKIGYDLFGLQALEIYRSEKINTEFIFTDQKSPSGVALISVDSFGENSIIVAPGASRSLSIEDINKAEEKIKESDIILMQLEVPIETVEYAATIAYKYGKKVILNPAPASTLSNSFLKNVHTILPNRIEAEMLSGIKVMDIESAHRAAKAIGEKGIENVVITLGKDGAYVKEKDIQTIINGAVKNDEFCKKYKKLPQYEEAVISWSDNMSDEDSKKLYNTFLDEVSKMSFEDWYLTVNGRKRGVSLAYVDISFSLNGTKYTSEVLIGDKMPNTLQAYMNAVNKYVAENKKDSYESMCNYLDNIETEKNKDNYTCYISVYDVENNTQSRIWSENMDGNKIVPDLKENLKNISPEKKFDLTKPVIEIIFYGNRSGGSFSYFFQMDGYDSLDDFNNQGPIGL